MCQSPARVQFSNPAPARPVIHQFRNPPVTRDLYKTPNSRSYHRLLSLTVFHPTCGGGAYCLLWWVAAVGTLHKEGMQLNETTAA